MKYFLISILIGILLVCDYMYFYHENSIGVTMAGAKKWCLVAGYTDYTISIDNMYLDYYCVKANKTESLKRVLDGEDLK